LASLITDISGASDWFKQGWVVYSNESKMRELGVEKKAFDEGEAGAVSHEVAIQMAKGAPPGPAIPVMEIATSESDW
jgi:PncC family amidohydrolase